MAQDKWTKGIAYDGAGLDIVAECSVCGKIRQTFWDDGYKSRPGVWFAVTVKNSLCLECYFNDNTKKGFYGVTKMFDRRLYLYIHDYDERGSLVE